VSWISSVAILDLIAKKGITTRGIAATNDVIPRNQAAYQQMQIFDGLFPYGEQHSLK
jgi:hypothetical protein